MQPGSGGDFRSFVKQEGKRLLEQQFPGQRLDPDRVYVNQRDPDSGAVSSQTLTTTLLKAVQDGSATSYDLSRTGLFHSQDWNVQNRVARYSQTHGPTNAIVDIEQQIIPKLLNNPTTRSLLSNGEFLIRNRREADNQASENGANVRDTVNSDPNQIPVDLTGDKIKIDVINVEFQKIGSALAKVVPHAKKKALSSIDAILAASSDPPLRETPLSLSTSTQQLLFNKSMASSGTVSPQLSSESGRTSDIFDSGNRRGLKDEIQKIQYTLNDFQPSDFLSTSYLHSHLSRDTPVGAAYLEATDRLKDLEADLAFAGRVSAIGGNAKDLLATIEPNGRGKIESFSPQTTPPSFVSLYEGEISESSTDPVHVALRAVKLAGGNVRYVAGVAANASLRDMLKYYGVEPSDPKSEFEKNLAMLSLRGLHSAANYAESQDQWGLLADIESIQFSLRQPPTTGEQYIAPSKWSQLGQDVTAGRTTLKQFIESDDHRVKSLVPVKIPLNSAYATVDKDDTLLIFEDYFDAVNVRQESKVSYPKLASDSEIIQSLREHARNVGGKLRLDGGMEIRQALEYYGTLSADLTTSSGRAAAASQIGEIRAKELIGERAGSINIDVLMDADDQATILSEIRAHLAGKSTSLLDELGKGVIDSKDEADLRKTPYDTLYQVLNSSQAAQVTKRLLRALDWAGAEDRDVVSSEMQAKLLQKAIALQLEADAEISGNGEHTLGYQLEQPDNGGKTYGEIFSDFEQHLQKENLAGSRNSAILTALAYRPSMPAEFAVRDIPPAMRYQTSLAWVKFAQGLNVAQNWRPDAIPQMSFGDVVDLPYTAAAAIAQQEQQATTDTERQNARHAKEALDLAKLAPVFDWAVARGMLPAKQDGETFSLDDQERAISRYESEVTNATRNFKTLSQPLPSLVPIADAELRKAGINPDQELEYLRATSSGRNGTRALSEYVKITPRDLYFTGEIKNFGFGIRDARSKAPFDTKSAAVQGLPDIRNKFLEEFQREFQAKYDSDLAEMKRAYRSMVKSLLNTIPLKDRQAMYSGRVKIFSVSKDPDNLRYKKGELGTGGFLMEVLNGNDKFAYEIFPRVGQIRRSITGTDWPAKKFEYSGDLPSKVNVKKLAEGSTLLDIITQKAIGFKDLPQDAAYFTTMEWGPYSSQDGIPGAEGLVNVTVHKIGDHNFPPHQKHLAEHEGRQVERDANITNEVADKIFLAYKDDWLKIATGYSARQAILDGRTLPSLKDTLQFLKGMIPIYGSIKDLQSADNKFDRLLASGGLLLDIVTLGLPVAKLLSGTVRAGLKGAKLGWKAGQQTLSTTFKKYAPEIADELLVIPGLGKNLTKWGIKFDKTAGAQIAEGLTQLRRTTAKLDDVGGLSNVTDPRMWTPARTGDVLRTMEGVENVPVRNIGTLDKPEFSVIDPKTGKPYGPRYIQFGEELYRKPQLTGFDVPLSQDQVGRMTSQGNGVWDVNGTQYVKIDGKYYESVLNTSRNERYIKYPTDRSKNYRIQLTSDGTWQVVPGSGRGGGNIDSRAWPELEQYAGANINTRNLRLGDDGIYVERSLSSRLFNREKNTFVEIDGGLYRAKRTNGGVQLVGQGDSIANGPMVMRQNGKWVAQYPVGLKTPDGHAIALSRSTDYPNSYVVNGDARFMVYANNATVTNGRATLDSMQGPEFLRIFDKWMKNKLDLYRGFSPNHFSIPKLKRDGIMKSEGHADNPSYTMSDSGSKREGTRWLPSDVDLGLVQDVARGNQAWLGTGDKFIPRGIIAKVPAGKDYPDIHISYLNDGEVVIKGPLYDEDFSIHGIVFLDERGSSVIKSPTVPLKHSDLPRPGPYVENNGLDPTTAGWSSQQVADWKLEMQQWTESHFAGNPLTVWTADMVPPRYHVRLPAGNRSGRSDGYMDGVIEITPPGESKRYFVPDGDEYFEVAPNDQRKILNVVMWRDDGRRVVLESSGPIVRNEHNQWTFVRTD